MPTASVTLEIEASTEEVTAETEEEGEETTTEIPEPKESITQGEQTTPEEEEEDPEAPPTTTLDLEDEALSDARVSQQRHVSEHDPRPQVSLSPAVPRVAVSGGDVRHRARIRGSLHPGAQALPAQESGGGIPDVALVSDVVLRGFGFLRGG